MANASAAGTVWNCPNYLGEFYLVGQTRTPFLNMIGGIQGGGKMVGSWSFPLGQSYAMEAASQPAITETASLTAPTPITYVREQTTNVCQIFQKKVSISYAKQSDVNTISGLSITGEAQPVQNEADFQKLANLKQIAIQADYTFLNGAYQISTASDVANKTRGLITAITTNAVAAGTNPLTKDMINTAMKAMLDSGSPMGNIKIWSNSFQLGVIDDLYGFAPADRNTGGTSIKRIITPYGEATVEYDPNVPAGTLAIADMSVIGVVFLAVPGKGILFYEPLSKAGASEDGQIYGQMGLDYGHETYHAKITGLTTS